MVSFSSACCARAVGIAYEPVLVPVVQEQVETDRHTDRHTHTHTHRPSTVTLAAHARQGLIMTKWRD